MKSIRMLRFSRENISTFINKEKFSLVFWMVLLLSITSVYISFATEKITRWHFYNSDALYIPALYRDFLSKYSLLGWTPPPVPYFFPDIPLYFLLNFFVGSFHLAIVFYGIVQSLLFIIGLIYLSNKIFGSNRTVHVLILFAGSLFFLLFATGKCPAFLPVFLSDFHFAAFFLLIFSLLLVTQSLQYGSNTNKLIRYYGILCILSTLVMASDAIYLVQFLIPMMLSLLLLFLLSMIPAKPLLYFSLFLAPSIPIGGYIARSLMIYRTPRLHANVSLEEIIRRGVKASKHIRMWREEVWVTHRFLPILQIVWSLFMVIIIALFVFLVVRAIKNRERTPKRSGVLFIACLSFLSIIIITLSSLTGRTEFIWLVVVISLLLLVFSRKNFRNTENRAPGDPGFLLFVAFFVFSFLTNIASAFFIGGSEPRYFLPVMLIPIFFGWPFLIARSQKLLTLAGRKYVQYALVAVVFLFAVSLGVLQDFKNISSLSQLLDYYPDFVKCMDRKAKERQLQNGLSLYWYAKYLSMLSKNNLHVVQVNQAGPGLLMKHWINNLNWYNNDFEFVIADEVSEAFGSIYSAPIIEGFGEPVETFSCEHKKVLVYNRKKDEHFQKQFRRFFSFEFYAAQLPSNTGRMYGLGRIAREETDERGALTYGPYLDLLIGDYYFEIHYFAEKNDSGKDVGKWDIVMHLPEEEAKNLKEGTIDREGNNTISGVFKVRDTGKLEIRTHYKGRGILRVDKIKIKRIR